MKLLPTVADFETYVEYIEIGHNNSQDIWVIKATIHLDRTPLRPPRADIKTKMLTAKIRNRKCEATFV